MVKYSGNWKGCGIVTIVTDDISKSVSKVKVTLKIKEIACDTFALCLKTQNDCAQTIVTGYLNSKTNSIDSSDSNGTGIVTVYFDSKGNLVYSASSSNDSTKIVANFHLNKSK